jgi:HAD superfamily hydrolase (TIGR01509 family)
MYQEQRQSGNPEILRPFPIKAIIYDLDGLIVDSEELWWKTCGIVLDSYGIQIREEYRAELMGRGKLSSFFAQRFGVQDSIESIRQRIWGTFFELAQEGLKPMPGAVDSVKRSSSCFDLAVASSAHLHYVEMAVDQLEIKPYFKVLVGGDQVERAKPHPDIFLKTAILLGVDPRECLVLEDSPNGIAAAKTAAMFCIAVPNRYLKDGDFSKADLQIPSLEFLNFNLIKRLTHLQGIKN